MKIAALLLVFLSVAVPASSVSADEFKTLDEAIRKGAEATYPLVRCAGLYFSGLEWAGEDRLGKETSDSIKLTVANLIELATEMRTPTLGSSAQASVIRDISAIAEIYHSRYEANYASSGEAFGQDVIWISDSQTCIELVGN